MKPTFCGIAVALFAALLAACTSSGSMTGAGITPSHSSSAWRGPVGSMKITFTLAPKGKHNRAADGVTPNFLPTLAHSVNFTLVAVNGVNTSTPTPYDFSILTSTCTAATPPPGGAPGGYTCSAIVKKAPAANDQWTIVAQDAQGTPVTIAETNFTVSVGASPSPAASGKFTLNPIVASMAWSSGQITAAGGNGPNTPSWNGTSYVCSTAPTTYCYDPIVDGDGIAAGDTLQLLEFDPDGEQIVPFANFGNGGASAPAPYMPIFVGPGGNERNTAVTCQNPDVEWLNVAGPVANASVTTGVSGNVANGFNGAAGTATYNGQGNSTGNGISFNSPLTGSDTSTLHQATQFSGATIGDGYYGNDGVFLNYDGGGNGGAFNLTGWTCTATDGTLSSGPYYFGMEQGQIGWTGNLKTHGKKHIR